MKELIMQMYRAMAWLMIKLVNLPGSFLDDKNTVASFAYTAILFVGAFALVIKVVGKVGGRPKWTYIGIGALPILIITHCAALDLNNEDLFKQDFYQNWIVLLLILVAIGFLIVNFRLDKNEGINISLLWLSQYLLGCAVVRVWQNGWTGSRYKFSKVLWVQEIMPVLNEEFLDSKFPSINYTIICVILLIAICMGVEYIFSYAKKWLTQSMLGFSGLITTQVLLIIPYIVYNNHSGLRWTPIESMLMLSVFFVGTILYLLIFLEQLKKKDKSGCIAVVAVGGAGILIIWALYISKAIVNNTDIGQLFNLVNGWMNFVYEKNPFSTFTKMGSQPILVQKFMYGLALTVTALVVYVTAKVVIDDRGKAKIISRFLVEPLNVIWVRNCVLFIQIPLILSWINSVYSRVLGNWFGIIQLLLQIVCCFGIGLVIAAIIIPIPRKKSIKQVGAFVSGILTGILPATILPLVLSWI